MSQRDDANDALTRRRDAGGVSARGFGHRCV